MHLPIPGDQGLQASPTFADTPTAGIRQSGETTETPGDPGAVQLWVPPDADQFTSAA